MTMLRLFVKNIIVDEEVQRYLKLIKICFHVLHNDSEEIGTIATKILLDFLNNKGHRISLSNVEEEVTQFCEDYLSFLAIVPTLAEKYNQDELK